MKNRRAELKALPVIVVSAGQSESNPFNPYDRLSPAERLAAVVSLLARIYQRLPESKGESEMRLAA